MSKSIGKNIGKIISKSVHGKYSQKLIDRDKKSGTGALKTVSERPIQEMVEEVGDLTGNKTADEITKISKILQENNSETVSNEDDKIIAKERFLSLEEKQKIIDDLKIM